MQIGRQGFSSRDAPCARIVGGVAGRLSDATTLTARPLAGARRGGLDSPRGFSCASKGFSSCWVASVASVQARDCEADAFSTVLSWSRSCGRVSGVRRGLKGDASMLGFVSSRDGPTPVRPSQTFAPFTPCARLSIGASVELMEKGRKPASQPCRFGSSPFRSSSKPHSQHPQHPHWR